MTVMHRLNRPATLRDVLEARNYVTRTVINSANAVIILLGVAAAIWVGHKAEERYGIVGWAIGGFGTIALLYWKGHIKPSNDLVRSEALCSETPYESD